MKFCLLSNSLPTGTRQIVLASICVYAFVINTVYARINDRPLRWLSDKMVPLRADDTALTHEDSESPFHRRENPAYHRPAATSSSYLPKRVTETVDLIPRVNGLSFVDDYPQVMRFHAKHPSLWTTQRTHAEGSELDGVRVDGQKCEEAETTTRRFSLQGVVAGTSFVVGLAVSMSICLLCYRIRRRTRRRTLERKQSNEASSVDVATVSDSDVKTEP